jgi:hypothetical protein
VYRFSTKLSIIARIYAFLSSSPISLVLAELKAFAGQESGFAL